MGSFLSLFFSANGRINRLTYFVLILIINLVLSILLGILLGVNDIISNVNSYFFLTIILMSYLFVYSVIVIKRLHDIELAGSYLILKLFLEITLIVSILSDKTGTFILLSGVGTVVLSLYILFKSGTNGENEYGSSPKFMRVGLMLNNKSSVQTETNGE